METETKKVTGKNQKNTIRDGGSTATDCTANTESLLTKLTLSAAMLSLLPLLPPLGLLTLLTAYTDYTAFIA